MSIRFVLGFLLGACVGACIALALAHSGGAKGLAQEQDGD
jgi:gas vesicle protein